VVGAVVVGAWEVVLDAALDSLVGAEDEVIWLAAEEPASWVGRVDQV
jgi:hypothetical protein